MVEDTETKGMEWTRPVVCEGRVFQDFFLNLPLAPLLREWKLHSPEEEDGGEEDGTPAELNV